jgi:hypothetical protein
MSLARSRVDFQTLAMRHLEGAKILLDQRAFHAAYYLAGYAVECGLKACVARRQIKRGILPDRKFSEAVYTHNLEQLVALGDLKTERQTWIAAKPPFGARWAVVARWNEQFRYEMQVSEQDAEDLYQAIGAPRLGVMTWLKKYW